MTENPFATNTPEQMADKMHALMTGRLGGEPEWAVRRAVSDLTQAAELAGEAHMNAVARVIASLSTLDESPTGYGSGMYDDKGRPSWHRNNILMSLQVYIGGRLFTSREAVDPMMIEMRFRGTDTDEFEQFVKYWIRRSFGSVADADEESYQFLRDRVWIVKPYHEHDSKRCHETADAGLDSHCPWPRCVDGLILGKSPTHEVFARGEILRAQVVGRCICRCHEENGLGRSVKRQAALHGISDFSEDLLTEEGEVRRV